MAKNSMLSYWVTIDLGIEQCVQCHAAYHVKARDLPHRSIGQFICQCGYEMNSWHGHRSFGYQLLPITQQIHFNRSATA